MKNILFLSVICTLTIIASLFIASNAPTTEGATEGEITGMAWSSTVGWISFDGTNYGVTIDPQTHILSGYAWSSNIGWVTFNSSDLVGCPTNPCYAKLEGTTFIGWAKATAANGQGWDGWIHLSGTNYGFTLDTDETIDGFAWGGPVVGWIKSYSLATDLTDTCGNGIDDDNDGVIDELDPDCTEDPENPGGDGNPPGTEHIPNPKCNNRYDDDADGMIDFGNDIGCTSISDNSEEDSTDTPEVVLKVGIASPSFESINLSKAGGTVLLSIDVSHATTSTTCTRDVISGGNTTQTSISTGGAATYHLQQSLSVSAGTKVVVTCSTAGKEGSDSVDIIIKDENEF